MSLSKTDEIDLKIERLRQKKKHFEKIHALELYKSFQGVLKDNFSAELVRIVFEETWKNATEKQKEVWLNKAHSFRTERKPKSQRKTSENNTQNHATS